MNANNVTHTIISCKKCGAVGEMACSCGEQYLRYVNVTKKVDQVMEALRDPTNTVKSNRALAGQLGIDESTVRVARRTTAGNPAVDSRIGRDGKTRRMPKPRVNQIENIARAIRAETGELPTRQKLAEAAGVYMRTADNALRTLKAEERGRLQATETMVDIHTLINELQPLSKGLFEESKKHCVRISVAWLANAAFKIQALLDKWAENDVTVRRVGGHVVPFKHSANQERMIPDGTSVVDVN